MSSSSHWASLGELRAKDSRTDSTFKQVRKISERFEKVLDAMFFENALLGAPNEKVRCVLMRMMGLIVNLYRSTFASKRQSRSRQSPNSSTSAKLDSNLIVDGNRQPIGRPWLSLAVHAAWRQILTIKGQRFA